MSIESAIDADYTRSVDARLASLDAYIDYQVHEARRAIPFLARFIPVQAARVLEVGTGRGGKAIAYACAGMRVTGLDLDEPALRLGAEAAQGRGARVQFLAGDGTRLPFPDNYYDAVLLDSVIEHVRDPFSVLVECARVVKPAGILFVVFPPHYGPLSGHIDDYVMIPWFHLLPRALVRRVLLSRPSQPGILSPEDAYSVYTTLNGMTIMRFTRMARAAGLQFAYSRARPFLTHPGTRLALGLYSAVRHAPRFRNLRAVLDRARREFDLSMFFLFLLLSAIAPFVFVPVLQEVAAGGFKCVLRKARMKDEGGKEGRVGIAVLISP